MPSAALVTWQTDRLGRLALTDAHCASLLPGPLSTSSTIPPPLAEESIQGYVMLVSGHFQGFCRDLYTECSQLCAAAVPRSLQATVQAQCAAELRLNAGNPTAENIRKDFERFGFLLDLHARNPGGLTHLGHLNYWRNAVAHQKGTPPPAGVPTTLVLSDIRAWLASCDRLAADLDDIMFHELRRALGAAPW